MTDRTIACIANGDTAALCGRANLAHRMWWCSSERVPLREAERRLKVCVCWNAESSIWAPQTLSTLLRNTLLYSGRLPELHREHQWRPCSAVGHTHTHTHKHTRAPVQLQSHINRETHTHTHTNKRQRQTHQWRNINTWGLIYENVRSPEIIFTVLMFDS